MKLFFKVATKDLSFHYIQRKPSCQVLLNWSAFARQMHSTTEFAMTVPSTCVTHVVSTRCRELLGEYLSSGRMFCPLTWPLNLHSLVIHLSKVEQQDIFRFSPCRMSTCWTTGHTTVAFVRLLPCYWSLVEQLAAVPGFISCCQPWKFLFSTLIRRLTSLRQCNKTRFRLQDMPFKCGHFLSGWSGDIKVGHDFEGWLLQRSMGLIWIFGHWAWSGDSALDCCSSTCYWIKRAG